jgi:hypothetical protein
MTKLYIVTMQTGPDTFSKGMVFAIDMDDAKRTAEQDFGGKCVNVRRAASHP